MIVCTSLAPRALRDMFDRKATYSSAYTKKEPSLDPEISRALAWLDERLDDYRIMVLTPAFDIARASAVLTRRRNGLLPVSADAFCGGYDWVGGRALALWPTAYALERLDQHAFITALAVIPWQLADLASWIRARHPLDLLAGGREPSGSGPGSPSRSSPLRGPALITSGQQPRAPVGTAGPTHVPLHTAPSSGVGARRPDEHDAPQPGGFPRNHNLVAADRLVAALRREKRLPDEGSRADLAHDFLAVATLLDRAFIGLKPAWHGERTNEQAHAILERAYHAMGADLQGVEHDPWEKDSDISALLKSIRPRERRFHNPR